MNVEPINVTLSPFRVGNTSVNVRVNSISSVSLDDSTSLSISTIEPFFLYDCGFGLNIFQLNSGSDSPCNFSSSDSSSNSQS